MHFGNLAWRTRDDTFLLQSKKRKNRNVCVMTSPHFDGQLIDKIIRKITNGDTIKGSSNKDGAKVLRQAFKVLKSKNLDLAIAPDGPRGPRHKAAQGIVVLSQRLKVPIVTVNCKASSFWQFNSWDKMFLPKPFSRIDFYIGEPFLLEGLDMNDGMKKVQERLMKNVG